MKTTFIILALMCTDFEQDIHCYKAVIQRPEHEKRNMSKVDLMCDTFVVMTNVQYEVGDKVTQTINTQNNETNK